MGLSCVSAKRSGTALRTLRIAPPPPVRERLEKNRASDPRYAGCVLEQLADVPLRAYLSSDEGAIRNGKDYTTVLWVDTEACLVFALTSDTLTPVELVQLAQSVA